MIPQFPSFFGMLLMQPSKNISMEINPMLKDRHNYLHHIGRAPLREDSTTMPQASTFLNSSVFLSEGRADDVRETSNKVTFI